MFLAAPKKPDQPAFNIQIYITLQSLRIPEGYFFTILTGVS